MVGRLVRGAGIAVVAFMLLGTTQCQTTSNGVGSNGPDFVTTLAIENTNGTVVNTFTLGQPLQFVLSVRNRSSSSQTLSFNTSQQYNFTVLESGSATEVWTWSLTQVFSQATTSLSIPSGQTDNFSVTWNQLNDSDQAVSGGSYEVIGGVTCVGNSSSSTSSASNDCMPAGVPAADQLAPSVYISTLVPFTIE